MIEPNFVDDIDMDICGFFDHIDDLLDFPSEDVGGEVVGEHSNGFRGILPAPPDCNGSVFSDNGTNNSSELPTDLSVSNEDIAHMEWLSNFVEDSFSAASITLDQDFFENNNNNDTHQFQTSSPISVLESSSSCSDGKSTPLSPETGIPGRARSKRPRPATFNPRSVLPLISSISSVTETVPLTLASDSKFENFSESHPSKKILKPEPNEHKKKKKNSKSPLPSQADQSDLKQQPVAVRKCLHCEITKTPQWRTGPMGPKTLCNACGVRYKSGRLFPEYRPAASPTFVASLHSCSHKKVLEMRIKADPKIAAAETVTRTTTTLPEFVPRSSHLPDYI